MHRMSAAHKHHRVGGGKQIHTAYWTIGVQRLGYTLVIVTRLDTDAGVALFAVKVVFSQPLSYSANPTIIAVINVLTRGIVIKHAYRAEITRERCVTLNALIGDRLLFRTQHAHNAFRFLPIDRMG
jgi:hypothetical protein